MKQVNQILKMDSTNLETKSYDESFLTKCANEEKGNLNDYDGYDCAVCKNKGYIYVDDEENEVVTSIITCECVKKRKIIMLTKNSGLQKLMDHRIKDFNCEHEWQSNLKKLAIEYIQTNPFKNWFCLLGQSGSGKTHICSAITNALLSKGKEARYICWNTFVAEVKEKFKENKAEEFKREYQKIEILYIDDLFKGSSTDFDVKNICFDILNYRYNNNLITIISSELYFDELNEKDAAIAGRIKEKAGSFIGIIPKDHQNNFRLKNKRGE